MHFYCIADFNLLHTIFVKMFIAKIILYLIPASLNVTGRA